jgi:polyisoprenoid-binding protein YceI
MKTHPLDTVYQTLSGIIFFKPCQKTTNSLNVGQAINAANFTNFVKNITMKKLIIASVAFILASAFIVNEVSKWSLDGSHSRLGFTITHMGITDVHGEFSKFDVNINQPNADFSGATIEMSAEAKSINTGISMRDDHLRGEDYFNVEKFQKLSFKSVSVKKVKENEYEVVGDFTMHGVTKKVTLTAIHTGTAKTKGGEVAGLKITGIVKRSDFGVGEIGPGLSDDVKLIADLELAKEN